MSNVEFRERVNEEYTKVYWIIYNNMKAKYPKYTKKQLHTITRGYATQKISSIENKVREMEG